MSFRVWRAWACRRRARGTKASAVGRDWWRDVHSMGSTLRTGGGRWVGGPRYATSALSKKEVFDDYTDSMVFIIAYLLAKDWAGLSNLKLAWMSYLGSAQGAPPVHTG